MLIMRFTTKIFPDYEMQSVKIYPGHYSYTLHSNIHFHIDIGHAIEIYSYPVYANYRGNLKIKTEIKHLFLKECFISAKYLLPNEKVMKKSTLVDTLKKTDVDFILKLHTLYP